MPTQPTLFISHGSPMHAVQAGRAGVLWAELGQRLLRPAAILIASAHWETELPMVATSRNPETIHDFGGFPPELYRIKYPAPGAPQVAEQALALLKEAGFVATPNGCRGLDHGARSEEHTSELQSHVKLVCRLLLEKKKNVTLYVEAQCSRSQGWIRP